jgi:peptide/nickel transport system permease protein
MAISTPRSAPPPRLTAPFVSRPQVEVVLPGAARRAQGPWQRAGQRLRRNRVAMAALTTLLAISALALITPVVVAIDPLKQDLQTSLLAPGMDGHLLGTDHLGRDVLLRLVDGARVSLSMGVIAVVISVVLGAGIGLIAGYFGGHLDRVLMRLIDVKLAFPGILLALVIVTVLGTGLEKAMIAVGIGALPRYARVVRGSVLAMKHDLFVEAARSVGATDLRLMLVHIIPHVLGPIVTLATLGLGTAILATASLSFLGLGAQPPMAEWGLMLADGRKYLRVAWWLAVFPGLAIMLTVFAVNLLGDGVRDALDPRMTSSTD